MGAVIFHGVKWSVILWLLWSFVALFTGDTGSGQYGLFHSVAPDVEKAVSWTHRIDDWDMDHITVTIHNGSDQTIHDFHIQCDITYMSAMNDLEPVKSTVDAKGEFAMKPHSDKTITLAFDEYEPFLSTGDGISRQTSECFADFAIN